MLHSAPYVMWPGCPTQLIVAPQPQISNLPPQGRWAGPKVSGPSNFCACSSIWPVKSGAEHGEALGSLPQVYFNLPPPPPGPLPHPRGPYSPTPAWRFMPSVYWGQWFPLHATFTYWLICHVTITSSHPFLAEERAVFQTSFKPYCKAN